VVDHAGQRVREQGEGYIRISAFNSRNERRRSRAPFAGVEVVSTVASRPRTFTPPPGLGPDSCGRNVMCERRKNTSAGGSETARS